MKHLSYQILKILSAKNATTSVNSITLNDIIDNNINVTRNTINNELQTLEKFGYVQKGLKRGRAFSYYITTNGINVKTELEN